MHKHPYCHKDPQHSEDLRLEAVTVSVGFDDLLDITLTENHRQLDHMIVVTTHADRKTQKVCSKHSATCVQSDLFTKNGRHFNKGAAINDGFNYFQYHGWRMHLDSDIMLPDNFRRVLLNHTHLHKYSLYGCDRVDVIGDDAIDKLIHCRHPQHCHGVFINPHPGQIGHRFVTPLHGYMPLGFFQLWHAVCQKPYPYSLGTAAHDDTMFSALWPRSNRVHLPTTIVYHLCPGQPTIGQNWDGNRRMPRIRGK